jgi:hypothetical protein
LELLDQRVGLVVMAVMLEMEIKVQAVEVSIFSRIQHSSHSQVVVVEQALEVVVAIVV